VTGGNIRLQGYSRVVTRGTPRSRHAARHYACNMYILLNIERNEARNPKVRLWLRRRKSHDSDMFLVCNGP